MEKKTSRVELKDRKYLDTLVDYSRQLFNLSGVELPLAMEPEALEAMRNSGMPNVVLLLNYASMTVRCIAGNVEQVIGCPSEALHGQSIDTFYALMTPKHQVRFSKIAPELSESVRQRVADGTINDSILNIQNQIVHLDSKGRNKWVLAQVFYYFVQDGARVGAALQMTDISSLVVHGNFSVTLYHKSEERIIHTFSDSSSIHLTKREREIFELLSEGRMEKEIAAHCDISLKTVKNHKQNVFKKLEVTRTVEAIHKLEELGLL